MPKYVKYPLASISPLPKEERERELQREIKSGAMMGVTRQTRPCILLFLLRSFSPSIGLSCSLSLSFSEGEQKMARAHAHTRTTTTHTSPTPREKNTTHKNLNGSTKLNVCCVCALLCLCVGMCVCVSVRACVRARARVCERTTVGVNVGACAHVDVGL